MAESQYRTIFGVVQFDPQERQANGKDVLSVTIRAAGVKDQSRLVSCTLWPSHKALFGSIAKGDAVVVEGKYAVNNGTDGDGNPKQYHNLSVAGILKLGSLDTGEETERTNSGSGDGDAANDEDW